ANRVLGFPTTEVSYILLYQDNTRLFEKQKAASLTTTSFLNWNIAISGDLVMSIDGTPEQDHIFTSSDFNGTSFSALQLSDWVTAFNNAFAGITAVATSNGSMTISSNKIGSTSSLRISGGTYLDNLFPNIPTSSVGQNGSFILSRETGNLEILKPLPIGSTLSA